VMCSPVRRRNLVEFVNNFKTAFNCYRTRVSSKIRRQLRRQLTDIVQKTISHHIHK